jgi:hypothetical protein
MANRDVLCLRRVYIHSQMGLSAPLSMPVARSSVYQGPERSECPQLTPASIRDFIHRNLSVDHMGCHGQIRTSPTGYHQGCLSNIQQAPQSNSLPSIGSYHQLHSPGTRRTLRAAAIYSFIFCVWAGKPFVLNLLFFKS